MAGRALALKLPNVPRGACKRALIAGGIWGLTFGIGMTVLGAAQNGILCIGDAAMKTTISVAVGILTMGPLAAFWKRCA